MKKICIILILILIINSVLLNIKLKKNVESFETLTPQVLEGNIEDLFNKVKNTKNSDNMDEKNRQMFNDSLKKLKENEKLLNQTQRELLKQIIEANPLLHYDRSVRKSCSGYQIDIPDKVVSSTSPDARNINVCANACKDNKECLSFDYNYNNNTCRFSTFCHKDSEGLLNNNSSVLYTKKNSDVPAKSHYDIHSGMKMRNIIIQRLCSTIKNYTTST